MYTITLKEALKRLDNLTLDACPHVDKDKIVELVKLVYKSGKHDGWYEHIDAIDPLQKK